MTDGERLGIVGFILGGAAAVVTGVGIFGGARTPDWPLAQAFAHRPDRLRCLLWARLAGFSERSRRPDANRPPACRP